MRIEQVTEEQIKQGQQRRQERHDKAIAKARHRIQEKAEARKFGPVEELTDEERSLRNAALKAKVKARREKRNHDSV